MGNERRPGDWQHRSHREANTIVRDPSAKKWYRETFWIIFFLVVLWPVGLVLMWRGDWPLPVKCVVTAALAVIVFMVWSMYQAVLLAS
ncbi:MULTISPECIES: holotricin-3 [unclassified Adlercreutzia]|uniref:holotricin-3 n=1 Tax=unclassified Adlercreutzia TaxID=2636013 RepID=UPI0013EA6BBD|nr:MULTISPECIES: holotricin-3 [unclassified Adlercreutzia]